MIVELAIGDLLVIVGIVAFPDDCHLGAALLKVAIDTVVRHIGEAVVAPFYVHCEDKTGSHDIYKVLKPVDSLAVLAPECLRIIDALLVPFLVGFIIDQRPRFGIIQDFIGFLGHLDLLTGERT